MKKYVLYAFLMTSWAAAEAQIPSIQNIDLNDVRGPVQANGTLWWDYSNTSGLEVPKAAPSAPKKHTIYTANLWVGGLDTTGNLYTAGETYRQQAGSSAMTQISYSTGPIATTYANQVPFIGDTAFNHVWKISRAQLLDFLANYQQPAYQIPAVIARWPAAGNIAGGRAPFIDTNSDGVYTPASGDYPDFPGDQALYFITNDEAQIKDPYTPALRMETQGFVYTFDAGGSSNALDQTVFVRYLITNRSTRNYHDFYFGHWVDFDLGNYTDDYVGCDRARQMAYVYNGDSIDEGTNGYGANPPAQGVVLLSHPMAGFSYYNNDFSVMGNPQSADDFYNYLRGRWRDGQPFKVGGDGRNTSGSPTTYMFDGDPVAGTGWTERNAGNIPGDRRGLMTAGPYYLAAGQTHTFELAYVFGQSPQRGVNLGVLQLRQKIDQLRAQYAAGVLSTPRAQETTTFTLSPNPATRTATTHANLPTGVSTATLTLRDGLGRTVRIVTVRSTATALDLRGLAVGLYHATLTAPDGRALARQRLVVAATTNE